MSSTKLSYFIFFTAFIVFTLVNITLSDSTLHGLRKRRNHAQQQHSTDSQPHAGANEYFEALKEVALHEQESDSAIQNELLTLTQDAKQKSIEEFQIQHPLYLSMIFFHYENRLNNLKLLSVHSLAQTHLREDLITHFNQKINEAEAQNLKAAIAVPRVIHVGNGAPQVTEAQLEQYNFSLNTDSIQLGYELRPPQAEPFFSPFTKETINPFVALMETLDAKNDVTVKTSFHLTGQNEWIVHVQLSEPDSEIKSDFYFLYEPSDYSITARQ